MYGRVPNSECDINCEDRIEPTSCGDILGNGISRTYSSIHPSADLKGGEITSTKFGDETCSGCVQGWGVDGGDNSASQWMLIDLGENRDINGLAIQGRRTESTPMWVKKYSVAYYKDGETDSNRVFIDGGDHFIVPSNKNGDSYHKMHFKQGSVTARYVKIVVKGWVNHIVMRAGVLFTTESLCFDKFKAKCGGLNRNNVYSMLKLFFMNLMVFSRIK